MNKPLEALRHHVSGAIERGEKTAVTEVREPGAAIRAAIFAAETVAHLRGLERELLPSCDAARAELDALNAGHAALLEFARESLRAVLHEPEQRLALGRINAALDVLLHGPLVSLAADVRDA